MSFAISQKTESDSGWSLCPKGQETDKASELLSRRGRSTQPGGLCPKGTTGLSPGF